MEEWLTPVTADDETRRTSGDDNRSMASKRA